MPFVETADRVVAIYSALTADEAARGATHHMAKYLIMDTIKEECDREGVHLYLETEKEDNLPFYEKHGLTVLKEVVFKKINMPMWLMTRKPQ